MGLSASQARLLMLVARKSDLELQGQFINQARLSLAQITGQLFNLASNLDPTSQEMSAMQARIAAIQSIDKSLELMLRQVDTQREAVMTEVDAVSKVIKKNIAMSFKTFA